MPSAPFSGFPQTGVQFLRELSANNNKAWFEANKARYIEHVQTPAIALVEALGERLHALYPDVSYDTRTNGSGSLLRLHRDTRFSADKSPYKTNVAMMFAHAGHKKMEAPGFGLQITPQQVDVMAGIFGFSKPGLQAYREAVLDDRTGAALVAAAEAVRNAGDYTFGEESYKRVPSGYAVDHPRANWLKFSGLYAMSPAVSLETAATPAFVDALMEHFVNMAPIRQWLVTALAWSTELDRIQ